VTTNPTLFSQRRTFSHFPKHHPSFLSLVYPPCGAYQRLRLAARPRSALARRHELNGNFFPPAPKSTPERVLPAQNPGMESSPTGSDSRPKPNLEGSIESFENVDVFLGDIQIYLD
jgi:hypothetical protein